MEEKAVTPDLAGFAAVDHADDPAAMIAFLETSDALPGIRAVKATMLETLRLGDAQAALDVGCGFGADVAEMLGLMPPGATATGLDISETMIAEARRRTARLRPQVTFDLGSAMDLPYDDGSFGACRAETVLQHLAEPEQAIREMARVTRPGGRIAVLEFDLGAAMVDHPDREMTRMILDTWADDAVQGWIGRQLPRLFRQAGLADMSVTPTVILADRQVTRMLLQRHIDQLSDQNRLAPDEASQWWSRLGPQTSDSPVVAGSTAFLVAATRR